MATAAIPAILTVLGCATPCVTTQRSSLQGALASIGPVGGMESAAQPARNEPPQDAATLLERGFSYFQDNKASQARDAFVTAIGTGNLNDAGRVVAYWHIYLAEAQLGNDDASADALTSFLAVAEEVIEARDTTPFAVDEEGDFVDRFDLPRRMARARAILSAAWAGRNPGFGRSAARPVLVRSDNELSYFLELAPPCNNAKEREVLRLPSDQRNGAVTQSVAVRCDAAREGVRYFFEPTGI